jgi:stage V sporulation protein SpoVS
MTTVLAAVTDEEIKKSVEEGKVSQSQAIYILWAGQPDAVAATIFATELRRVGLATKFIGMHTRPTRSQFGIVIHPDLSLDDVFTAPDQVVCLIIPGRWTDLRSLLYDPRLVALIDRVYRQGGTVLVADNPDGRQESYADRRLLSYPPNGSLLDFARELAQSLLMVGSSQSVLPYQFAVPHSAQRTFHRSIHRTGDHPMGQLIRVASDSQAASVAGSIANTIRQHRCAEVQAIGVSAVNNMMKATIIARRFLIENNLDLLFVPDFANVVIDQKNLTALKLHIWAVDLVEGRNVQEDLCPAS